MRQGWRRVLTASGRSYCLAHEIWPLYTLKGHRDLINTVAFLSDKRILAFSFNRRLLASGSADSIVIPWDVESVLYSNRPAIACFIWEGPLPRRGKTPSSALHQESNFVGEIVKYAWNFDGDGAVDTEGQKIEWTFTGEGTYTMLLIVSHDHGVTVRKEVTIQMKVEEDPA